MIRPLLYRASAYALVAAVAEAFAWSLSPVDLQGLPGIVLIAAILGGPLLSGLSLYLPRLHAPAAVCILAASLAVTALALWTIEFSPSETAGQDRSLATGLSSLAFWPLIVTGLLAGGALDALATAHELRDAARRSSNSRFTEANTREQFARSSGALINYAMALTLSMLSILFYATGAAGVPSSLGWLIGTPIHLAILVLFAAICCLLVSIWLDSFEKPGQSPDIFDASDMILMRRQIQRRFLRTLIALLPVMGFLGTVWGIKIALSHIPEELFFQDQSGDLAKAMADMTASLKGIATAFETTLLGLLGSIAATLALAQIERAEAFRDAKAATGSEMAGPE
jgi:hypothetical protein